MLAATIAIVVALTMQSAGAAVMVKGTHTAAGFRWRPGVVSVAHGTRVVWKAASGSHTVTAYGGRWHKSTTIAQGTTTSFTFRAAGVYRFRCLFHSTLINGVCRGMCGKVIVG